MSSVDITHLPQLVADEGYELMFQNYDAAETVYQDIVEMIPWSDENAYGYKGSTIIGGGRLKKRGDGQKFEQTRPESGFTYQIKVDPYGREITIPRRMLRASNARGRITQMVQQLAQSVGRLVPLQKDELIANLMQKGTLAAGSDLFDGSFPDNADPNSTKIYDGQPFFSAAHVIKVGSDTYSNLTTGNALTESALTDAKVLMEQTSAVDDRGEPIMNVAGAIVVPPSMEATALRIVNSQLIPGSANNDVNVHAGTLRVIKNRFLRDTASAAAWWLMSSNVRAIAMLDSGVPEFSVYEDKSTDSVVIQLQAEFGANVKDWRGMQANNKATS